MSLPALQDSQFHSLEDKIKFGELVVTSGLALGHKNAASVVVALQFGSELGLSPMQALRLVAVINGKPSLSADGCVAVVKASAECEYFREVENTTEHSTWETQRRGHPAPDRYTFTLAMAKAAGLLSSQMYGKYMERMLAARAKKYLAQDVYPDIVGGILSTEEAEQIVRDATPEPPLMPRRLSERPEAPPPDPVVDVVSSDDPDEARIGAEVFGEYGEGRDPTDVLGDDEKAALKAYVLEHGLTEKALGAYCKQLGVKKGVLTVAQAKMIRKWVGAQGGAS